MAFFGLIKPRVSPDELAVLIAKEIMRSQVKLAKEIEAMRYACKDLDPLFAADGLHRDANFLRVFAVESMFRSALRSRFEEANEAVFSAVRTFQTELGRFEVWTPIDSSSYQKHLFHIAIAYDSRKYDFNESVMPAAAQYLTNERIGTEESIDHNSGLDGEAKALTRKARELFLKFATGNLAFAYDTASSARSAVWLKDDSESAHKI